MSIESRYDNILSDMFTLLQQALVRFMTNQKVDLAKFKHYFCKFTKNMTAIQQQFHSSRIKLSDSLTKLQNVCLFTDGKVKFSLQPSVSQSNHKKARSLTKDKLSLNVIGQQKEQQAMPSPKQVKKRSGTAGGTRSKSGNGYFSIDYDNGRPLTGTHHRPSQSRYRQNNPTMNTLTTEHMFNTEKKQRQSFYDELQKESNQTDFISENIIKLPRKKLISQQRRSYKINKLF